LPTTETPTLTHHEKERIAVGGGAGYPSLPMPTPMSTPRPSQNKCNVGCADETNGMGCQQAIYSYKSLAGLHRFLRRLLT